VPWLAAKAKEEGMPLSQLVDPSPFKPGVGHSKTGMHSADDLFAPIAREAAVDLRFAPHGSPASVQNPHLRNASLVISHDAGWVDPFESLPSSEAQAPPAIPGSSQPSEAENPLDGWALKDEPQMPIGEAPAPQVVPESSANVPVQPQVANPFAEFESTTSPQAKASPSEQVAVSGNAFNDPLPNSRTPSDPHAFDPTRSLFKQDDAKSAPSVALPPGASPQDVIPAKVSANAGNNVQESPEALTWETARVRLKELGITKYYVQPDATGRVFHFHCAYVPPDNPRVTRLFEADATEPLEAVRKVLAQVENWKQRQSVRPN
jgi:hypothetical protein